MASFVDRSSFAPPAESLTLRSQPLHPHVDDLDPDPYLTLAPFEYISVSRRVIRSVFSSNVVTGLTLTLPLIVTVLTLTLTLTLNTVQNR